MRINKLIERATHRAAGTYDRMSYRRKGRLYCVGAAKSGTHSIDAMFDGTVRENVLFGRPDASDEDVWTDAYTVRVAR